MIKKTKALAVSRLRLILVCWYISFIWERKYAHMELIWLETTTNIFSQEGKPREFTFMLSSSIQWALIELKPFYNSINFLNFRCVFYQDGWEFSEFSRPSVPRLENLYLPQFVALFGNCQLGNLLAASFLEFHSVLGFKNMLNNHL